VSALALAQGFAMNPHLLGVYGFAGTASDYAGRLALWCAQAGPGDLLMCHPALAAPADDPIAGARTVEYAVLAGERFAELQLQWGLRITRLSAMLGLPPRR
jgi:hypothetical protein